MDKNQQSFSDKNEGFSGRYHLMFWGMIFFFMILGIRLWYLQVIKGDELRRRTESNQTRVVELSPVRGLIQDRQGLVLVDNRASFDLYLQKSEVTDASALISELAAITGRPAADLEAAFEELPKDSSALFISGLTREELVAVECRRWRLPGLSIKVSVGRVPLTGVLAPHIIGYINEISQRQLDNEAKKIEEGIRRLVLEGETRDEARKKVVRENKPHRAGDLIGQSGIEQSMEWNLQGRRGSVVQERDSRQRLVRELDVINPEQGYTVRLTLDSRLQAMAQSLLGERAGAIVVMDPNNFEILALASSPTFDLSDFAGGISSARWRSLQDDPFKPMFNRAVAGSYAPGSTFKIVVAATALAEGIITPETVFHCQGSLKLGRDTFGCHSRYGHGAVDLKKSLKYSCDVYYYEVGHQLKVDRLARHAREYFGLGRKTGVELGAEASGLMPDSQWKERTYKEKWRPGETLPVSIGQGAVVTSPLQVAQFTAVVANGGYLYRPHLVKEIVDVNGQLVKRFEPELVNQLKVDPRYIRAIQEGLEEVVNDPGGTGRRAALPDIAVAGKTGTTQVVSQKSFKAFKKGEVPYAYRDHAWFTSYAPAEQPKVVVTVLLEHTGGGGTYAAPVAKQMLEAYFDPSIVPDKLPQPQVQPDQAAGPDSGTTPAN